MLRAGMIRKLAAGVYNYMPMGLRSLKKIERIVREEMDRAGAIELLMPIVSLLSFGRKPAAGRSTALNCFALKIDTTETLFFSLPAKKS